MRRRVQTFLASVAMACALALTASSTVRLVALVNVPGWAHPFAVGMLEVLAVTGTWLLLTERRMRIEAGFAVLMASGVTAAGGLLAYGPFGLVAPVCSLLVVHLVARAWSQTPAAEDPNRQRATVERADTSDQTAALPAPDSDETHALPPGDGDDQPDTDPQLDTVRKIVANGGGRGTVADELNISPSAARTLIAKAKAA